MPDFFSTLLPAHCYPATSNASFHPTPRTDLIIRGLPGLISIIFRSLLTLTSNVLPPSLGDEQTESSQIGDWNSSSLEIVRLGLSTKYLSKSARIPGSRRIVPLHHTSLRLKSTTVSFKIIELAGNVVKQGNKNAVTDAAVAVMMARTAALSALYNVKINLASIKDTDFVKEIREEIEHMESEIEKREREIISDVSI